MLPKFLGEAASVCAHTPSIELTDQREQPGPSGISLLLDEGITATLLRCGSEFSKGQNELCSPLGPGDLMGLL